MTTLLKYKNLQSFSTFLRSGWRVTTGTVQYVSEENSFFYPSLEICSNPVLLNRQIHVKSKAREYYVNGKMSWLNLGTSIRPLLPISSNKKNILKNSSAQNFSDERVARVVSTVMCGPIFARFRIVDYVTQL